MGVWPSLPMGGIHVILGNDLAGESVWPRVAEPMNPPIFQGESSESPETPVVLSTCAVTRATSRGSGESCVDNRDKEKGVYSLCLLSPCLCLAVIL